MGKCLVIVLWADVPHECGNCRVVVFTYGQDPPDGWAPPPAGAKLPCQPGPVWCGNCRQRALDRLKAAA